MNVPELFAHTYDNALLYYPNIFFVIMPVVIGVLCVTLLRGLKDILSLLYVAGLGLYTNKKSTQQSIKFFQALMKRMSKFITAFKKEVFINPKDL